MKKNEDYQLKFELDHKLYIRLKVRKKNQETGKWERSYFTTGLKLKRKSDWNNDKERVKSSEKDYIRLNNAIEDFEIEWNRKVGMKSYHHKDERISLIAEFENYIKTIKNSSTQTKYNSVKSWVNKYRLSLNQEYIYIDEINK